MTAPIFIEQRGLSGLGNTDFVPGQSYQSIIGSGYQPVPQYGEGQMLPPPPASVTSAATAAPSPLSSFPRGLLYAGAAVAIILLARKLMR